MSSRIDNRWASCPWCGNTMRQVSVRQHIRKTCKGVPEAERERLSNPKEPTWQQAR
jgi:hypothetical protein